MSSSLTGKASELVLPDPSGYPGAPFPEINLKLVVLSALLDNKTIDFGPVYGEFISRILVREYDLDLEGYEPNHLVFDYLARYPLTPEMLGTVETLIFDGSNSAYNYIWPYWGGDSDMFDVYSLKGIEFCPNIRNIDVTAMLVLADLALLTPLRHLTHLYISANTVINIPALLDIKTLEWVRISNGKSDEDSKIPGHPTRLVMEALMNRGVHVQFD